MLHEPRAAPLHVRRRDTRRASARPTVSGWLTSIVTRPASDAESCARPSWRMIES